MLYREELEQLAAGDGLTAHYTLTREPPPDSTGFARWIDAEMLTTVGPDPACEPRSYVRGSPDRPIGRRDRLTPIAEVCTPITIRPPHPRTARVAMRRVIIDQR